MISASTPDDAHKAVCVVTVVQPQNVSATGVQLNKNILILKSGQSETLVASIILRVLQIRSSYGHLKILA
jgi:uncharacterized protein YjdB